MNIYFLVEGLTECEFYPQFIEYYFGELLKKVDYPSDVISNSYYLIGDGGYPFIYTGPKFPAESSASLKNAILDVNDNPVFDYLVICLDADELTIAERVEEFEKYVEKYSADGIILNKYCEFKLIVQNRCIESWFLGNKKIYKKNPSSEPLISYSKHYDISKNDPELMNNYNDTFSHQDFHLQYLRESIREKMRKSYKKESPNKVVDKFYMDELNKRIHEKNKHLKTLSSLVELFKQVRSKIEAHI